jgi:cellulose synthase/poly-beta-1,6-N-acetylglucosamine synthase-like glycosyltransferase
MPKISVILPAYNSQDYIKKSIESVFAQTFKHLWGEVFCKTLLNSKKWKIFSIFVGQSNRIILKGL